MAPTAAEPRTQDEKKIKKMKKMKKMNVPNQHPGRICASTKYEYVTNVGTLTPRSPQILCNWTELLSARPEWSSSVRKEKSLQRPFKKKKKKIVIIIKHGLSCDKAASIYTNLISRSHCLRLVASFHPRQFVALAYQQRKLIVKFQPVRKSKCNSKTDGERTCADDVHVVRKISPNTWAT